MTNQTCRSWLWRASVSIVITSSGRWTFCRIDDQSVVAHSGAGSQPRFVDVRRSEDVNHALSGGEEVVGNDAPVATPPKRFRAHDRAPALTTVLSESCQARSEGLRQSVVGVVSEAPHLPICVRRGAYEALLAA